MTSSTAAILPELAAQCACLLGEGPVWSADDSLLLWVDIKAPAIWSMALPSGALSSWTPPCQVSAIAPRLAGGLVAATEDGWAFVDLERRTLQPFDDPEPDLPGNRFNDGKVDRGGAFWAGTIDDAEEADSGALYRLDAGLHWTQVDRGYRVTNGPAFSPDGAWLYHADSTLQRVDRFPLHADGSVGARETFLQFGPGEGHPDGMTVDAQGGLWIALWDGWCLRRFNPDGTFTARIAMPVQRPTSCTFGGPDLDRLFITSAKIGLSAEQLAAQPHAGDLFVARPAIGGLVQPPFAG